MKPLHSISIFRRPARRLAARACLLLGLFFGVTGKLFAADTVAGRGENRERIEPSGFIYGGALGVRREIYIDYDRRVIPLPVIGYRGEKLQVFGPFVRYELLRRDALSLNARLSPRFAGFDESDSDIFAGMEDRQFSMDLGLGVTYERNDWKIEAASLRDLLDRSNGHELKLRLGRALRLGKVFIEPTIGLSYLDRKHVDYYYGVDETEATSFRPSYDGKSARNTELGANFVSRSFFGGLTRVSIENTWYDSSISDSPLTEEDSILSFIISFAKFFK